MRFLLDQPVSHKLAAWLRSVEGGLHDAVHVRDRALSRATDEEIFALAVAEQRVLVTDDSLPRCVVVVDEETIRIASLPIHPRK